MSARKSSFASRLVAVGGLAVLAVMAAARVRNAPSVGATKARRPTDEQGSGLKKAVVTYVVGYGLALALTLVAFALVYWRWAPPATALGIVFGLALVQILVHSRCFLHVTLHGPARDDLQLILFSTMIVLLMVGGTLVVLFNLRMRMM